MDRPGHTKADIGRLGQQVGDEKEELREIFQDV